MENTTNNVETGEITEKDQGIPRTTDSDNDPELMITNLQSLRVEATKNVQSAVVADNDRGKILIKFIC